MRKKNWFRVFYNFYLDVFIYSFIYNLNYYFLFLFNGENIDCIEIV